MNQPVTDDFPITFSCESCELAAVVSPAASDTGMLIIVGGPQYRVGSHRQFVLLARALARAGFPVMRFDYRGMGDAAGDERGFLRVNEDIAAAIDVFFRTQPHLKRIVLWGLCDAASAICFYAAQDKRISGLVLLNPWVREAQSEAQAYLKHYYWQRLRSPDFWKKIMGGGFNILSSVRDFSKKLKTAKAPSNINEFNDNLPTRMAKGLQQFDGKIQLILSGDDLTAQEFTSVSAAHPLWQAILPRCAVYTLPTANHTFSSRAWREEVERITAAFLNIFAAHQLDG